MYNGFRVAIVTLAGRRRYMELLVAQTLAARPLVDEHQLWINTTDESDLAYLRGLVRQYPGFFKPVRTQVPIVRLEAIPSFYRTAVDPGTLYIKLDDDVVYLAPQALENLVKGRFRYLAAPFVYANTVNNPICTYLHQRVGALGLERGQVRYDCLDRLALETPAFAEFVHRSFLAHPRRDQAFGLPDWRFNDFEKMPVNCIAWFGQELARAGGQVPVADEFWFGVEYPRRVQRLNWLIGDALVAHFAYGPQREHLDRTDLLACYRRLLAGRFPELGRSPATR